MTRYTRHNGWPFPEKNQREWHEDFELLISQLDADIAGINATDIAKDTVSAAQRMHVPVYADVNNYPNPIDGDIIYTSGEGVTTEGMYAYDGSSWIGPLGGGSDGSGSATLWDGLDDVSIGPLSDRPAAGTAGQWYITTDQEGAFYDDGSQWLPALLGPGGITQSDLTFDPVTNTELTTHTDTTGAHHTRYSDDEARTAVIGLVDAGALSGVSGTAGQVLHTDGASTYWAEGGSGSGGSQIASGVFTHTTGGATEHTVTDVTTEEQVELNVTVAPDQAGQTTNDYAFNSYFSQRWDESTGSVVVDIVVNWDIDPGSDMTFNYTVRVL